MHSYIGGNPAGIEADPSDPEANNGQRIGGVLLRPRVDPSGRDPEHLAQFSRGKKLPESEMAALIHLPGDRR